METERVKPVEPNLNVGGAIEPFCLKMLAGELRWIAHRDAAMERRILVKAKILEDKYYAGRDLLEERRKTKAEAAELESKELREW